MTLTASFQPQARPALTPAACATLRLPTPDFLMEVVLPDQSYVPSVPNWTLKLWPSALLGDATLQAHPHHAHLSAEMLLDALQAQGVQTLGLRTRRVH